MLRLEIRINLNLQKNVVKNQVYQIMVLLLKMKIFQTMD